MTNWELFYEKSIARLRIDSVDYKVVRDAPSLEEFSVQLHPFVGCPLMARCRWGSGAPESARLHWFSTVDDKLHSRAGLIHYHTHKHKLI